jgi:CubicO group peptidase (beta-lactamase class C family)
MAVMQSHSRRVLRARVASGKGGQLALVVPLLVVLILAGCVAAPVPLPVAAPPAAAPAAAVAAPVAEASAASTTIEEKIKNAESAAPTAIGKDATIVDWPAQEGGEMITLREGSNGWTCYTDWPASPTNDPECNDAAFEAWFRSLMAGEKEPPKVTSPGLSYMLQGGTDPSNTDPFAAPPASADGWVVSPAHLMIVAPWDLSPADFSTNPQSGEPYIMWEGTPYEHLMIPLVPTTRAEMGDVSGVVANIMAAAPPAISLHATILGNPAKAGDPMVELRQGDSKWICYEDRSVSPGNDPACYDAAWNAFNDAYAAGTNPATAHVGIGYMLVGGSDESNTDPMAMGPMPGDDWIVTAPHLMVIVPAPLDPNVFTTDHASGFPYIMWKGTSYEHLMIPLADLPTPSAAESKTLSPADQERATNIGTALKNLTDGEMFSGAVLVARDGQVIFSQGYGLANRELNISNTPQTVFRIGEISMQFTVAAMLLLEQDGKLSLQDPICKYLEDCPEAWQAITIHHLLSRTSGIPDYFDTSEGFKAKKEGATLQQLIAIFHDKALAFTPGTQRVNSHSGFVLAGLIIERVSGQPYADFVTQHILRPLEMMASGCGDPGQSMALGYAYAGDKTPETFAISALYGSGGCYSTAEDLFRWNEGLYNSRLLNAAQWQKMLTRHAEFDCGDPQPCGSGYGIVVWEDKHGKVAGSGGVLAGYTSAAVRYLDDHLTILSFTNQDTGFFLINDMVVDLYFRTK